MALVCHLRSQTAAFFYCNLQEQIGRSDTWREQLPPPLHYQISTSHRWLAFWMQVHSHHAHTAPTKPWWVKRCCASYMYGPFQNTCSSIFTKDASFMDSLHVFNTTALVGTHTPAVWRQAAAWRRSLSASGLAAAVGKRMTMVVLPEHSAHQTCNTTSTVCVTLPIGYANLCSHTHTQTQSMYPSAHN